MNKAFFIFLIASLFSLPFTLHAQASDQEIDGILTSAEGLFKDMKARDYQGIWPCLSRKSRDTIVGDTCKAVKSATYTEQAVAADFSRGGAISKAYWDAYLKNFDPAMVLDESRWEMGTVRGDRAEIMITHRKALKPATLYMSKEDGMWRVGLVESFWSRK